MSAVEPRLPTGRRLPTRPVVPTPLAVWLLVFAAVVPAPWDPPAWALTLGLLLLAVLHHRANLSRVWFSLPLVAYLGWIVLSALWSVEPVITATQTVLNLLLVGFGLLIAVGRSVRHLLGLATSAMVLVLLACWLVVLVAPSVGLSSELGRAGAMQGLFTSKNALGFFSTVALVTTGCHCLTTPRGSRRLLGWAAVALTVVTMAASGSRTAWAVSAVLLLVALGLRLLGTARRPLLVPALGLTLPPVALLALAIANLPTLLGLLGRDPTLTGRTHIWQIVTDAVVQRPLTGYGFRALWVEDSPATHALWARNYDQPFWHAHNGYLDVTLQIGLVGAVLAFLVPVAVGCLSLRRFLARPDAATGWPVLLVAMVLLYNATEVVGFTGITWVLLVALLSVPTHEPEPARATTRPDERTGPGCISPMPSGS